MHLQYIQQPFYPKCQSGPYHELVLRCGRVQQSQVTAAEMAHTSWTVALVVGNSVNSFCMYAGGA